MTTTETAPILPGEDDTFIPLGDNVAAWQSGAFIFLRIDKRNPGTPSSSGKTLVIASTRGNQEFAGLRFGVNVYRYPSLKDTFR